MTTRFRQGSSTARPGPAGTQRWILPSRRRSASATPPPGQPRHSAGPPVQEPDLRILVRALGPGEVAVDLTGASAAYTEEALRAVGPNGRVVRPTPAASGRLGAMRRALLRRGRVEVIPGDRRTSLDGLMRGAGTVALLRCRVDDANRILNGDALTGLAASWPTLVCPAAAGADTNALTLRLAALGYRAFACEGHEGRLRELPIGEPTDGSLVHIHPTRLDRFR